MRLDKSVNMGIELYYHPERKEYVFVAEDNYLRVDEKDFDYLRKSLNPLFYQMRKSQKNTK